MIRAHLTGINVYAFNPTQNNLRGCVNDANNLKARWNPGDYSFLYDVRATKFAVMAAWREMLQKCVAGDILRISHSSHGIEEGICCTNLMPKGEVWDPDGYISYHEIAEFCKEIPASITAEFLLDCCHCERQLKGLGRVYGKAKYMQAQADQPLVTPPKPAKPKSVAPNIALWAACEPNQTSADAYIDNQAQGAFTAAILMFAKKGRTRTDVIFYARKWLGDNGYDQRPHLYTSPIHAFEAWL